jgi:SPP1 family phage portal protein
VQWVKSLDSSPTNILKAEWYDKKNVYYYSAAGTDGRFKFDGSEPHGFEFVPLFEVVNNKFKTGDYEKTETLIDAYDRSLSDTQNEEENFANAYLVTTGAKISPEQLREMKQSGVFFTMVENGEIKFLTKDSKIDNRKTHLDILAKNIYKFSKSVDINSDTFTGAGASGEARKWSLLNVEADASIKESKFKRALKYQFQVLASAWEKAGVKITYEKLKTSFSRNIPIEYAGISDFAAKMNGIISQRTLFDNIPFIQNSDDEIERIKQERAETVDLDAFADDGGDDDKDDDKDSAGKK